MKHLVFQYANFLHAGKADHLLSESKFQYQRNFNQIWIETTEDKVQELLSFLPQPQEIQVVEQEPKNTPLMETK